jgi:hypothetical protein
VVASGTTMRARRLVTALVLGMVAALVPLATGQAPVAFAGPIADNEAAYAACGRVFPDPLAYWVPGLGEDTPHPGTGGSPWAKGNAPCAARTFMSYDEAIRGLTFLADELELTRDLVDVIDLSTTDDPRIREVLREELGDGFSEGLPDDLGGRERTPLVLVKVTAPEGARLLDDVAPVAEDDREHFVWSLSMHGIERAGVEGGVRAVEDLVTWGATEPERPLLETLPEGDIETLDGLPAQNLRVGEVLMRSVSYFVLPNPDGWRRGDVDQAKPLGFMRYNGNGMDLNRDWPEIGYTDPSFTPWSESESRTLGKVLQNLSDNWTGGIDLHGMVAANAFSYTLIGGSQRPYAKNQRVMQFVREAWRDAETRLAWSPEIKPNDAPDQCVPFDGVTPTGATNLPPGKECDQRAYGVQYGTIWDTINYTVTGAMGNWIDSPVGLNADGIDNEMMLSHLGNCGVGTCYLPEAEQLHVDGNKSLIYAMLNFQLQPPPAEFEVGGDVAYLVNPRRLVDEGVARPTAPEGLAPPADRAGTARHPGTGTTVLTEFRVDNGAGETYVGGISASVRWTSVRSASASDVNSLRVQYRPPGATTWTSRPVYAGGPVYFTPGARSDWNFPLDGDYRVVVTGLVPTQVEWRVAFTSEPAWEQPVQEAFDVSNMDFFDELAPFLGPDTTLTPVSVDAVLAGRDLSVFDSVIAVDGTLLPGYHAPGETVAQGLLDLPRTSYSEADADRLGARLRAFAESGGNVVLTDDALRGLAWMGVVAPADVRRGTVYAGNVAFPDGFGDPLAEGLDLPGAATGRGARKQLVEPVPIGYALNSSQPQWNVRTTAVTGAGGRVAGREANSTDRAALAELPVGDGVVRVVGSLLPFPTTAFYHPFGMSSYSVTDNGYTVLRNVLSWDNPAQSDGPIVGDPITWTPSATPTRVFVDGTRSPGGNGLAAGAAAAAATVASGSVRSAAGSAVLLAVR